VFISKYINFNEIKFIMKKLFSLFALGMLTMSAWAANTYVKVASVDQLEIGKKYILVNEEANVGMGALSTTSTMYGTTVAITIDNEAVDIEGASVLELTAHKANGDQGGWIFEFDENHFIAWISGNSLTSTHNTTGAISLNEQWYATATDDGVILKSRNDESRILQYNSTSPRFACYTSSQKPAVLYVQDAGYTPPVTVAAPTLPESQEFENSLSVSITNNEEGADLMYALNDGEFTEYTEALTITETTTVYAKAVKGDVESEVVSATYTKVEPVVYTKPYVKVNSADELEVGKKYILVNEERKLAMGEITGGSTHYGSHIEIPIVEDVAYIGDTEVVELTLGKGTMDVLGNDTWTFEINGSGRYILWNSGNSLDAVTGDGATSATGAQWIADETEDGVVLLNKSDNARKLQYNASSPRFACYTTSQQPAVLYVEYEPQEEEGITTLSEANALEDGENFTFNGDAVVTICWKGSVYLRDESGYGQIVDSLAVFENGQVLNPGWNATKTSVNGWVKFIDDTNLSASGETNAELAAAQKITSVDESMLNAYVYVENVYKSFLPIRSITLEDGTNISLTGTGNQPAMGNYNIYGIIWKSGDKLVFEPVAWETYDAPPTFLRGDVNDDGAVTIADVAALADYLLSNDATDLNLDASDCDQNGSVGVNDVASLIDYILNGEWFD
jgi:hypothetical protein